ncbi:MAG: type I pullulanase [Acutalibacteraceae bacterium]|nr:type I pullulanase [Acutalibacteraceae bacterium]
MKLNKIIAAMLAVMMVGGTTTVAVAADPDSTNPYEAQAAKYDEQAYSGNDLGAIYSSEKTTFKVWSPSASKVVLNLFATGSDEEEGSVNLGNYEMTKGENAVWSFTVNGDLNSIYYTYSVTNNGVTEETVDPYAKAVGVNGERGMVVNLDETDPEGWENDNGFTRVVNQTDASVWEVHVKDFSYDESSGVSEANRGKYLAFTETGTTLNGEGKVSTGVDYLKELGVNYVQIVPFYDYGSVDESGSDTQFNWGYDPKNYNAPEGSYSSNPYDGNVRITEAKQMIQSLHNNGIGVIMDVVYNHTYSTDSVFQKTVPDYYYRMNEDGSFSSGSGCGNDTASEREMYRKYMIDSVTYWAKEYHIDGFRFDLMGLHDVETMNAIRAALDEIDPDIIMYGEGWTMSSTFDEGVTPSTQANAKYMDSRIGCFNDQIRDGIKGSVFDSTGKGYVQGDKTGAKAVYLGLLANTLRGGNWQATAPEQTVTYASCHDNATLYDRLVYSMGGDFEERYDEYIRMNKLAVAITMSSQGTVFMQAGEEFARTKLGDENSYSSSVDINKLDWTRLTEYGDLVSYYKGMLEFRDYFTPVRTATKLDNVTGSYDTNTGIVQMVYANQDSDWKNVVMLFNDSENDETVTLDSSLPNDWVSVVNGSRAGIAKIDEFTGKTITVPAGEALILVDKNSYEASGVVSNKGTVEVRHINQVTGEVMSTITLVGNVGEYYYTTPSHSYDLYYNQTGSSNNTEGVYTNGDIVVEYYYAPNDVQFNDISGDGKVTIVDAVMLQKYLLGKKTLTDEQVANIDVNMNGKADLADAVLIQRYLLGFPIPKAVGTVTVSFVDQDGNKLKSDVVTKMKAGEEYSVSPDTINYYVLDETQLPNNATGKVCVGNTIVTYVYSLDAISTTVRVQMPEGSTDVPNLYVWEEGGDTPNCGAWPGTPMTDADGDGWYEISFATSGTYNWIVNYGASQTTDMTGFSGDQWIVMEDATTPKVVTTTVNVKMPADVEWTPYLYVWQTSVQTEDKDYNPLGNWPGTQMTDFDKDGWYTVNFYCKGEGYYNWIVNNNSGLQTEDNKDVQGSLWIEMKDATTPGSVTTEKPEA